MISIAMDNTSKLYQFDINRRVIISGLPPEGIYQIHFKKYMKDSDVIVKEGVFDAEHNISAQIPNSLLTNSNMVSVYVYGTIGTVTKTFHTENLLIVPRPKPEGYVLPDDEDSVNTYKKLVAEIDSLKNNMIGKDDLTDAVGDMVADKLNETVIPIVNKKVDKVEGKGLSTNDFTDDYKMLVDENNYRIGTLDYLNTNNTDNLVAAINEIYMDVHPPIITNVPTTLDANTQYNFGEVATLNLVFPTVANDGDVIYLTFKSGATPTVLTIDTTNTCDIDVIPESNTGYEIFGKFNGDIWIVNYSEYTVSEG